MDDLAALRARFAEDRFATDNGCTIEAVTDACVTCAMALTDRHRNARGAVMGGAMFTLADFTFAVAANRDGRATVSLDADMRFLTAPRGSQLTAQARLIRDGRSVCVYQVEVRDSEGRLAALATTTGAHV